MAFTKFQEIRALAEYTSRQVTENEAQWREFLDTAARFSKYPFKDQVLIYAQRPEATACASLETWNEKMNCWVNKGAKGIALIDDEGAHRSGLKYVFDVADVHEARFIGRKPKLWKMRPEHEKQVIEDLEKTYGETSNGLFADKIRELSERIAEDMTNDYIADQLLDQTTGSYLEDLDEQNITVRFRETLADSIAYTVLSRCGYKDSISGRAGTEAEEMPFRYITDFNTVETLSVLGTAAEELVAPMLMQIGRSINEYEINREKGLANNVSIDYNALKRESNNEQSNTMDSVENGERSEHETGIRTERGLSDSEPDREQGAGGGADEVRSDAQNLPQGTSERDLRRDADERHAEGALPSDSEAGGRENGLPDGADGERAGSDGRTQEQGSDGLGDRDERDSLIGGGSGTAGADPGIKVHDSELKQLNLFDLFPSFEEQMGNMIAAEAGVKHERPAAFSLSEEQIGDILRSGGGRDNSKKRIYAKYKEGKSSEEMQDFLRDEYGVVGKGFTFDNHPVSVWFDEKGMQAGYGTSAKENILLSMNWKDIESRIRGQVEEGSYVSQAEAFLVGEAERKRVANHVCIFFREGLDEMKEPLFVAGGNFPENESKIMELLKTEEGRNLIREEVLGAKERLDKGKISLRWNHVKKPDVLLRELADLDDMKLEFPIKDGIQTRNEDFITQDEIDAVLRKGGSFAQGRMHIYQHFQKGMDKKENVAFLKREYGIGGHTSAIIGTDKSWEDHDAKGIRLSKGRISEPSVSAILKWEVVEKRIRELIEKDQFLSEAEKETLESRYLEESTQSIDGREEEFGADGRRAFPHLNDELPEEKDQEELTAADFENLSYVSADYGNFGHTASYELEADIKDAHVVIYYEVTRHDGDEESFSIHTIDPDIYDMMSESELIKLEGMLSDEVRIGKYEQKIQQADSFDKINDVRYEFMEDEAFPQRLSGRFWEAYGKKEGQLKETVQVEAKNFHITDERLGVGGPKEKFRNNIAAIQILQEIEAQDRNATPEEQEILSKYVGWGGLADAFDETKANWSNEFTQLKSLLTPEEYSSARESTLNAHYTSPAVISGIYEALANMGFEKGNVLEPAMGIGNFFGMLPEKMQESRLYGVELDSISGRIAKQLYPKAKIQVTGYEKTDYPNDFFDLAVGNVPFGDYKVSDRQYDKNNFLIHDYFFAKTLDKVRPGGIVAFITSKGTMDKQNPAVRKYLAQRAELLGAIRLPNTAFKENAGTEVTSDILFFQKRDRQMDIEPDWVHLGMDENGVTVNQYFADHPEMVLGRMEMVSGPFGLESTCVPDDSIPFAQQVSEAALSIAGRYEKAEIEALEESEDESIPADPTVKNYSYCLVEDKVYYRENSVMRPAGVSESMEERIKGMIGIRDCTQELISLQLEEHSDEEIKAKQGELNRLYDDFSEKFGMISSQTNKRAFNQDSSYCLLCSLEKLDDEGHFQGKADMFSKRTIKKAEPVTSVDTASEALAVSLGEKAKVDLEYMSQLCHKSVAEIAQDLAGVIFQNPVTERWETADEYLSGNVREKLAVARNYAQTNEEYGINVNALESVQPKELDASEIEVRIGATWIDPRYVNDFMRETFQTPGYLLNRDVVGVQYSKTTGQWNIKGKNADYGNALVQSTYGTSRANAYKILEDSLNLKDTRVYDTVIEDGKEKRILNKKETMLASQKQDAIRETFKNWVFQEQERRTDLVKKYNELFNSTRPREYDGSHLKFPGMTPDIELKPHQLNAVAHVLYGNNTLLAHCVGAGKTFEMTAAAMESKRLGLCQKSLFVVPNHLTEQWASDFLRLYPGANILAATKKDFEPANRKKFCSRIATGDYDAVIIGHSQFEKIPLSNERQVQIIQKQIDEIETEIALAKADRGERYTIKEMEKSRKGLIAKLDKLNDATRKDNVVTFEQLGVDRLFVDESHNYKNLFLYTKMRNVAGIAQTEAQKSQDMFNKCQYLDELTGGRGVTFATGTPISNSMTELYTNMRYLQYSTLQKLGLGQFDSWAATFGETQTAIELAPEGTGYRAKTRFSKFFNLPELISLFKESADIQTPDMLKLPVPEADYENVVLKPSDAQKDMVKSLADRAERVRNRAVDSSVDNMLKITNDGRKLALDQRLISELLPDDEASKTTTCVENAFKIWQDTADKRSTQLIFCDLSTPKGDGTFNVYDDIRNKLVEKGVPRDEIAFIHEANTELRKAELFAKVRSGQVRFLIGSTAKMGAGTNVQDRLIALHHLDVPWRPSDIEQQEGRILRQGNQNPRVKIFRYVTEGTFDAYSWQLIENKQKFIGQIMTSKSPVRSCEDIDDAALSYAEVKALATGNPYIKEKMDLDIQVSKLKLMKANHTSQRYRMEDDIAVRYPSQISTLREKIEGLKEDIALYNSHKPTDHEEFHMTVTGKAFEDRKEAGNAIIAACRELKAFREPVEIGEYLGMKMTASFDAFVQKFQVTLKGKISHDVEIGADPSGNISRINNTLEGMAKRLEDSVTKLENIEHQLEIAKVEVKKPFEREAELTEKLERLAELNALLNMDEKGDNALDVDEELPESKVTEKPTSFREKLGEMKEKVAGTMAAPKGARDLACNSL